MCLCSCTPSEGIHAQVTSQRGSGAPGKTANFTLVEVSVGTLHTGGGNLIPGRLHTGEGDRNFSGTLRTGEENRKKNLPGRDPRIVRWLATLLRRLIMEKEMTSTSSHGSESYVTNHRHLNELHRLSAFSR